MAHETAINNNLGINSLSGVNARVNFINNSLTGISNLSKRPDWDGIMSHSELVQWGKDNGNAAVYLDASKIDLGNINVKDLQGGKISVYKYIGKRYSSRHLRSKGYNLYDSNVFRWESKTR